MPGDLKLIKISSHAGTTNVDYNERDTGRAKTVVQQNTNTEATHTSPMTLIVRVTEEDGSVSSTEKSPPPPLSTLGAPSPPSNQDIFSSPLLPHTKHQRQSLQPSFFLAVSTFSIVVLLWMQHICCMVLGTPVPYCPLQNQHGCSTNVVQLSAKNKQASGLSAGHRGGRPIYTW